MKLPNHLHGLAGRIGDFTIYESRGRMVVRSRHSSKSLSRISRAQRLQQARWYNAINLWHHFPPEGHPSYDTRNAGQTDMNVFISMCMHSEPIYFSRHHGSHGACVALPVCISTGPLKSISVVEEPAGSFRSDIAAGALAADDSDITVAQLSHAIIAKNTLFEQGDIIRFYLIEQCWIHGFEMPSVVVHVHDLRLDFHDIRKLRTAAAHSHGFALRDGFLAFDGNLTGGLAWVHLRHKADRCMHSTQTLCCHNNHYIKQYSCEAAQKAALGE